jgi:hypothetical protein
MPIGSHSGSEETMRLPSAPGYLLVSMQATEHQRVVGRDDRATAFGLGFPSCPGFTQRTAEAFYPSPLVLRCQRLIRMVNPSWVK